LIYYRFNILTFDFVLLLFATCFTGVFAPTQTEYKAAQNNNNNNNSCIGPLGRNFRGANQLDNEAKATELHNKNRINKSKK